MFTYFSNSGCDYSPAFFPCRKMDEESGDSGSWLETAGVLGGLGSVALNGGSAIASMLNNQSQMKTQKELAYNAQQLAVNMHQASLIFQDQQNRLNREWQEKEWLRQFNLTNQYNTPFNQVARLLAAGINPYASFNNTGTAQGSNPNTPIASTSSAPSGGSAGYSYQPFYLNPFQAGADIAQSFKILAEAKKAGVETDQLEKMFNDKLKSLQLQNQYDEVRNELQSLFGKQKEKAQVDKLLREAALIAVNEQNATYEGVSKMYEAKFAELREYAKAHLDYAEYRTALKVLNNWDTEFKSVLALRASQTSENYASAGERKALEKRHDQDYNINKPAEIRAGVESTALSSADGQSNLLDYYNTNLVNDVSEEDVRSVELEAERLAKELDLKYMSYERFIEAASKTLGLGEQLVQIAVPIGKFKQLKRGIDVMKEKNDLKNKDLEAVDIKTTETFNKHGQRTGYTKERKFKNPRYAK